MDSQPTVLVVDDERAHRLMMRGHLEEAGFRVLEAPGGRQALELAGAAVVDAAVVDMVMPGMDGLQLLKELKRQYPELPVVMVTAYGSVRGAVEALKAGAEDYLTKPLDMEELVIKLRRVLAHTALARQVRNQAERLGKRYDFSALIGSSPPMLKLKETLAMVAPTDASVLITGESGTGKEIVAQVIHQNSPRASGPMVKVNCAALPETLLESELFGHAKGAFTGATSARMGRFRSAHGGTIFLDEIAELPPSTQAKLLRVLQDGEIQPLGTDHTVKVDVRVIAATNRDLKREVAEGRFREDLFYRLNVVHLHLPPLRARGEDILLLARHFLSQLARRYSKPTPTLSPQAEAALLRWHWPGNVRELAHALERAVIMAQGREIGPELLPGSVREPEEQSVLRPGMTIKEAERALVAITLRATGGNRTHAAQLLGITRKTLQNKIKEYRLKTEA